MAPRKSTFESFVDRFSAMEAPSMSSFVRDWVRRTFGLWTAAEGGVVLGSDGIIELRHAELALKALEELRLPLRPKAATLASVKFSTFSR